MCSKEPTGPTWFRLLCISVEDELGLFFFAELLFKLLLLSLLCFCNKVLTELKKKKKKGQENLAFFYKLETRDMNRLVLRRALNFPAQFHNSADFSKRNAEEP